MILGSTTDRVQPKTIQLVFVASPLSIKEKEQRLVDSELE